MSHSDELKIQLAMQKNNKLNMSTQQGKSIL